MSLKASINAATITMILMGILFSFFTYTSKSWIEGMNTLEPRVNRLETKFIEEEKNTDRRLVSIEIKIDRLLERK